MTGESCETRILANRLALIFTMLGAFGAMFLAHSSNGFYQDDDIVHFKLAADSFSDIKSAMNVWGRPGYTMLAAPAAYFGGMQGCRLLSVILTAISAWMAYAIAWRIFSPAGNGELLLSLAPLLVWLGPVNMTLAVTSLTETAAMFYMTAAILLCLRGRPILGCAVMSLAIVSRYELLALGILPFVVAAIEAYRKSGGSLVRIFAGWRIWAAILAIVWAPAAYILAAKLLGLPDYCSPLGLFGKTFTQEYGKGSWHHFIDRWFVAVGAGTVALAIAGTIATGRRGWLVWSATVGLVGLHTLIFMLGRFESGGYARFLVPAGGLTAAIAACGLAAVCTGQPLNDRKKALLATVVFGILAFAAAIPLAEFNPPAWLTTTGYCFAGLMCFGAIASIPAAWKGAGARLGKSSAVIACLATVVMFVCLVRPLRLDPLESVVGDVPIRNLPPGSAIPINDVVLSAPLYVPERIMNAAIKRGDDVLWKKGLMLEHVITLHPLVWYLHRNVSAEYCSGRDEAITAWQQAAPGTLFFWDSKYGGGVDGKGDCRLYQSLWRRGISLLRIRTGQATCEIFVRKVDEPTD